MILPDLSHRPLCSETFSSLLQPDVVASLPFCFSRHLQSFWVYKQVTSLGFDLCLWAICQFQKRFWNPFGIILAYFFQNRSLWLTVPNYIFLILHTLSTWTWKIQNAPSLLLSLCVYARALWLGLGALYMLGWTYFIHQVTVCIY